MTFDRLPSGKWRCRVYTNGVQKSFTGNTKRDVQDKAIEWSAKLKCNIEKPLAPTLKDATDNYINSRATVLSPTTINSYTKYAMYHFQNLMDVPVDKIGVQDIQGEINLLAETKAPKTIQNIVHFYLAVLDYADQDISTRKLRYPQKKKLEYATPDGERLKQIYSVTKDTDIEIAILLASWCGMRMGEILGLKWDKVTDKYIIVDNTRLFVGGKYIEKPPKTLDSVRTIPMPHYIWKRLNLTPKTSEYVVPYTASHIRDKFHRLMLANDIKDCRIHDLRHSNASILLGVLNINSKLVQGRNGWNNPTTMNNVYYQTFTEQEESAANTIDNYFESLV